MTQLLSHTSSKTSQIQTTHLIQQILSAANQQISVRSISRNLAREMSNQLVKAESNSFAQFVANKPRQPYPLRQEQQPVKHQQWQAKMKLDAIRPFSAKLQPHTHRPHQPSQQTGTGSRVSPPRSALSFKSFKSINSMNSKTNPSNRPSSPLQYPSKLHPVGSWLQSTEDDKMLEHLRKAKQKARQQEQRKSDFVANCDNGKQQQSKFATLMARKQYTYTYGGEVVEIANKSKVRKTKPPQANKHTIAELPNKGDQHLEQPRLIEVHFTKGEPTTSLKYYVFGEGSPKPQFFSLTNTCGTKFVVLGSDF